MKGLKIALFRGKKKVKIFDKVFNYPGVSNLLRINEIKLYKYLRF